MKAPLSWIKQFCDTQLSVTELTAKLDLTGTAVERSYLHGVASSENFVVGRVLTKQQHPDADRLSVCTVDVGEEQPSQIVCGAANVAADLYVAVAKPGAVMPDGTKLKRAKLRGVESCGMILSSSELGLDVTSSGIMSLAEQDIPNDQLVPGKQLDQLLPISTTVLELEITPNRPDCLSIYGVARELHAATGAELKPPPWQDDPGAEWPSGPQLTPAGLKVEVKTPLLCERFTARVFENVKVGPSPQWLKSLLMQAGQRPISNVVDITNYVMLLTGQPSHAFDLDRIDGQQLTVELASEGQKLTTLDGIERTLDQEMVVISDRSGPVALAGVMGGATTEVDEDSSRVVIEVATWNGASINRTANKLALRSEASGRFEKQLSRGSVLEAQVVITQLMIELCGAKAIPETVDIQGPEEQPQPITLDVERIGKVLGKQFTPQQCSQTLTALGFGVDGQQPLTVTVPHFRALDVTREIDLIEEIGRIDGFHNLPETLPARREAIGGRSHSYSVRQRAEDLLVGNGFNEIVGWSFASPELIKKLQIAPEDPRARAITVANPMSEEHSIMRTTLLGSLLDVAARNLSRGNNSVRIFESGTVYQRHPDDLKNPVTPAAESHHIAALVVGDFGTGAWRDQDPGADFFSLKAVMAAMLDGLGVNWQVVKTTALSFLHPGKAAAVTVADQTVGWIGELHPLVSKEWGIDRAVTMFGFNFDLLAPLVSGREQYRTVSNMPPVTQDLALLVPQTVDAKTVENTIVEAAGALLERVELFDLYAGDQIADGLRSLAFSLTFRAVDRTLNEDEITKLRTKIIRRLEQQIEVKVRA